MTEHPADPDRPRRNWKIPTRIYGRVRTSTVLIGICFILTALLYDQVRPLPDTPVTGPTAVDTSQYQTDQRTYQEQYTSVPPTTTDNPSTTMEPSGSAGTSGTAGTSGEPGTSGESGQSRPSTSQDPTYLPGLTVPPQLRSLLPPAPAGPSGTGTP
ncbi:hypothetical protein QMK17_01765 [Rhodococcus sp. G-MC3]|uniref:hypothetical protein n=1 Tax=Rhodococcus sp. G-MC3 TaxID=3046209 RepID=UPI0024BAA1F6|nr:hypothetical protein [Rhodococcus sp. G-MC3]MDJ0392057.1 hypothetical protein [Rhodococcus sp. G-MC3]